MRTEGELVLHQLVVHAAVQDAIVVVVGQPRVVGQSRGAVADRCVLAGVGQRRG